LDAAKRDPNAFPQLEKVVCQYPGTFAASLAADEMARLVLAEGDETPEGESPHLYAMAEARKRCKDPVAVVQMTLEMGLVCWEELSDPEKARNLLNEAASDEHVVLAQRERVQNSLQRLPRP
jgi:hypothetical protein